MMVVVKTDIRML